MADEDSGRQIVATVTVALSGNPPTGLRIISDGSKTDCPADWTEEYSFKIGAVEDRVTATVQKTNRPMVSGKAQIGVDS